MSSDSPFYIYQGCEHVHIFEVTNTSTANIGLNNAIFATNLHSALAYVQRISEPSAVGLVTIQPLGPIFCGFWCSQ